MAGQNARPSCVALEKDFRKLMNHKIGDSILGKVRTSSVNNIKINDLCMKLLNTYSQYSVDLLYKIWRSE